MWYGLGFISVIIGLMSGDTVGCLIGTGLLLVFLFIGVLRVGD